MGGSIFGGKSVRPRTPKAPQVALPARAQLSDWHAPRACAHAISSVVLGGRYYWWSTFAVSAARDGGVGGGAGDERVLLGSGLGNAVSSRDSTSGEIFDGVFFCLLVVVVVVVVRFLPRRMLIMALCHGLMLRDTS